MMRTSFDDYVATRSGVLLRFAYLLTGDRHLAEDLVQEVLIKAHRRWSVIEAGNPDAYLKQALVRTHISWLRRRSSSEIPGVGIGDDVVAGFDEAHASRDEVWNMLARLPRAQRAVLVLRYFEDLDDRRIAELLGVSPSTVRVHSHRALLSLRETLASRAQDAPTGAGLLDNVRRGAARAAGRRRAATAGGIAIIVAAVIGGVLALAPHRPAAPVDPGPTSPSTGAAPTVTTTPSSVPVPSAPGTLVYLSLEPTGDELVQVRLHRVVGGEDEATTVGDAAPFSNCTYNMPTLSPDGRSIATAVGVGGADSAGTFYMEGDLYLTDVATRQTHRLASGVRCSSAIWTPDSTALLVDTDSGCRLISTADGSRSLPGTGLDQSCGYVAFAAGGAYRAKYPSLLDATGAVVRTLPQTLPAAPDGIPVEVFGVSDDGRLVAMGLGNTDPAYQRHSSWLYDTQAGRFIDDAELLGQGHAGETVTGIGILAGGGMAVSAGSPTAQAQTWYLLSEPGTVTGILLKDAPRAIETGRFAYLP